MSQLTRGHPPDGCYFLNCRKGNEIHSQIAYYANVPDGGNNNQQPDDSVVIAGSSFVKWEGNQQSFIFGNGTTINFTISENAQQLPNLSFCGTATNSFGSKWNIYKDDQRVMFRDGNGFECRPIYWCF